MADTKRHVAYISWLGMELLGRDQMPFEHALEKQSPGAKFYGVYCTGTKRSDAYVKLIGYTTGPNPVSEVEWQGLLPSHRVTVWGDYTESDIERMQDSIDRVLRNSHDDDGRRMKIGKRFVID